MSKVILADDAPCIKHLAPHINSDRVLNVCKARSPPVSITFEAYEEINTNIYIRLKSIIKQLLK